jgi:HEAT repeat protein
LREQDRHFVGPVIEVVKRTKSDQVLDHAAEALAKLDDPAAIPILKEAATRDLDAELLVHLGRALLDLRDPGGFAVLIRVLDSGPPEFARKEVDGLFQERTGLKLDDAGLRKWWSERGPTVKWKGASKRFE